MMQRVLPFRLRLIVPLIRSWLLSLLCQHAQAKRYHPKAKSGFALIGVLVLSVIIGMMIPVMLNLETENRALLRHHQARAHVVSTAHHMFGLAQDQFLLHTGLPLGWTRGDAAPPDHLNALTACSRALGYDVDWAYPAARYTHLDINSEDHYYQGYRLITAIRQGDDARLPFAIYVVMGCAISDRPFSQLGVVRGVYLHSGGRVIFQRWQIGSS
jgi:hypothetical protein